MERIYRNESLKGFMPPSRRDGLVVSMSDSHPVGQGFTPRPGHTKDHSAWHVGIKAGVFRPCDTIELTATSCNFSSCQRIEKVCVDRQLLRYS